MTATETFEVPFRLLDKRWGSEWPLPNYATAGSAGIDLRAAIDKPLQLLPGDCRLVASGLAIYLQNTNFAAHILPRSGLAHTQGLILGNTIGLIDSDYQGELLLSCWNRGKQALTIEPGQRIAQLVVVPIVRIQPRFVNQFTKQTTRGDGGYGHTGRI